MNKRLVVQQAIDHGIKNDDALRILLMAMIAARGYNEMQMLLYNANLTLSEGVSIEKIYEDIYG